MRSVNMFDGWLALLASPAVALIALFPLVLHVAKLLLDTLYGLLVTCVLAHVVAELDGWAAVSGGNLDDDVERLGFRAVGFVREVVCEDNVRLGLLKALEWNPI